MNLVEGGLVGAVRRVGGTADQQAGALDGRDRRLAGDRLRQLELLEVHDADREAGLLGGEFARDLGDQLAAHAVNGLVAELGDRGDRRVGAVDERVDGAIGPGAGAHGLTVEIGDLAKAGRRGRRGLGGHHTNQQKTECGAFRQVHGGNSILTEK